MSVRVRSRQDLCPGVFRPWPAPDGALVRLRLVGGRLPAAALLGLLDVAETHGDGAVHLTGRANLQLRGLPSEDGDLTPAVVAAIAATGLLPLPSHELVRNVMVSPLSGVVGGRADLRPVAAALDALLCADPALAGLPGRFLFVLDDGRGDLLERSCDLGLVAVSGHSAQLRVGTHGWGAVVPLPCAAGDLVDLARSFLRLRGEGPTAPWHVDELGEPLDVLVGRDPRTHVSSPALAYGDVPGGGGLRHVEVPGRVLTRRVFTSWCVDPARVDGGPAAGHHHDDLVVTPWHGVLVPAPVASAVLR